MTTYDEDMIRMVDARIDRQRSVTRSKGTMQYRARDGSSYGTVVMEGDSIAVPVQVLGNVQALEGDRVILDKYGDNWIVTGSFGQTGLGESTTYAFSTGGAVTNNTYIDLPGSPGLALFKAYDQTAIRATLVVSMWASNNFDTEVDLAYRVAGVAGTPTAGFTAYEEFLTRFHFNPVDMHMQIGGMPRWILGLPSGLYTFTPRWKRFSGGGNLNMDGSDVVHMEVFERWRAPA